jgi:hypothetical protein
MLIADAEIAANVLERAAKTDTATMDARIETRRLEGWTPSFKASVTVKKCFGGHIEV